MTIDEFRLAIENRAPPAPIDQLVQLEVALGGALPDAYRHFLETCNGGHVGGSLCYRGSTPTGDPAEIGVHHVGGCREETYLSLARARATYAGRIPDDLLWIMDDPYGNAICLGLNAPHRGRVFFWDHEMEPDPDDWNGQIETAENVSLIAECFTDFVAGLGPTLTE